MQLSSLDSLLLSNEIEELLFIRDEVRKLHSLRRTDINQQRFWNYFWHKWNYWKIKEAFNQAYEDMALDPLILKSKTLSYFRPTLTYNFETAVARDQNNFCSLLDLYLYKTENAQIISYSDLTIYVQQAIVLSPDYDVIAECEILERLIGVAKKADKVYHEKMMLKQRIASTLTPQREASKQKEVKKKRKSDKLKKSKKKSVRK